MNFNLGWSSLILFIVALILLFISWKVPSENAWLVNLLLNIGAGIIGSLVVIFLYDKVLERKQKNELKYREKIAIQQLEVPLRRHFVFLFEMFRCSVPSRPSKKYIEVKDVFDTNFYDSIKFLDFKKPSPASSQKNENWSHYIENNCTSFRESLQNIISKYAQNITPEVVEIIENINNSGFMVTSLKINFIMNFYPFKSQGVEFPSNFFGHSKNYIEPYVDLFIRLVEYYNNHSEKNKVIQFKNRFWHNAFFPIGCSRIDNE